MLSRIRNVKSLLPVVQGLRAYSSAPSAMEKSGLMQEMQEDGMGATTIAEILKEKRARMGESGAWLVVSQNDSVYAAIEKMSKANVGSLVVIDDQVDEDNWQDASSVVGILSERDYLKKIALQGRNSKTTRVQEIMTHRDRMITVTPRHSILEAMNLMTRANIRHLPVVDERTDSMEGLLSIRDVVEQVVREQQQQLHEMTGYLKGTSW